MRLCDFLKIQKIRLTNGKEVPGAQGFQDSKLAASLHPEGGTLCRRAKRTGKRMHTGTGAHASRVRSWASRPRHPLGRMPNGTGRMPALLVSEARHTGSGNASFPAETQGAPQLGSYRLTSPATTGTRTSSHQSRRPIWVQHHAAAGRSRGAFTDATKNLEPPRKAL